MAEEWTKEWERRVVNGVYPLRRFLGRSNHSVVFLTECRAQNVAQAAIKIMPADPALTETQLAHWRRLATLSHPHLIRVFDAGGCRLGGHNFLFVVMEHAEQNLAQILPGRALSPDEVRELLPPTLDALAYLHGRNLVHGALKPPNFLVVADQLKLASDTVRPPGERTASTAKPSLYDPPEYKNGRSSTAGDIWALGITLVEALTQGPPSWSRENTESVVLPANLAPEFFDTVQRCLNRDPARRPAIAELVAQFKLAAPEGAPEAPPAVPPLISEPMVRTLATQNSPRTRLLITWITAGIVVLWAVWTVVHLFHNRAGVQPTASSAPPASPAAASPPAASPPVAAPPTVAQVSTARGAAPLPAVLHQEMPSLSRSARASIRGVIKIEVRVTVDRSGNVIAAASNSHGSSKYFVRAASDAARKWKFAPAADAASRAWTLHFELTRAGVTADAAQ